jgi:DNA helicase-2/ATP-dependent DNA helicase PcrA
VEWKQNTASTAPAIDALLEGLNPAQRCAAIYGMGADQGPVPPQLIAAGAGTGKTKTLAHRVARLILGGADLRRLLLLTFTRRAALEMTRRAQQILVASRRGRAAGGAEAALLPWSGTFHSIGNRLLRRHGSALSLDPAFTALDRADSADLMDLVRSDLGLARTRSRFPKKGTCLAIYSYTVNAGCPLEHDPPRLKRRCRPSQPRRGSPSPCPWGRVGVGAGTASQFDPCRMLGLSHARPDA